MACAVKTGIFCRSKVIVPPQCLVSHACPSEPEIDILKKMNDYIHPYIYQ